MLRYLTAGESHGPLLTTIVEGMPAGLPLKAEYINRQLARRQAGYGRGGRMQIEKDRVRITSGVRHGYTLGSPITLVIENRDWPNWESIMDPEEIPAEDGKKITRPRPGHADLAGGIKYRQEDLRNILERASARETAARVAAGTVARAMLEQLEISIVSHVVQIGAVRVSRAPSKEEIAGKADASPVRCADPQAEREMMEAIDRARQAGDSLGGVFEVIVTGVPVGLGSHVHWDRRLDGRLAGAVMSIQGIKAVEIGLGLEAARLPGSEVHDEIFYEPERGYYRRTNRAGGLEGGITNGEPVVIRGAMKPIPTLMKPLNSVDMRTKEAFQAAVERSDVCAVPAASVVAEAVVAMELAKALLEKFPADHMDDLRENLKIWREYVRKV